MQRQLPFPQPLWTDRDLVAKHKDMAYEVDLLRRLEAYRSDYSVDDSRYNYTDLEEQLEAFVNAYTPIAISNDERYCGSILSTKKDMFGRFILCDLIYGDEQTDLYWAGAQEGYILGSGYFGSGPETMYDANGNEWRRSHTPNGVAVQGVGLGTALYSGMALAAFLEKGAKGIHSVVGGRSDEAEEWWGRATTRGYTDLTDALGREEDEDVSHVDEIEVDLEDALGEEWNNFVERATVGSRLHVVLSDIMKDVPQDKEDDDGNPVSLVDAKVLVPGESWQRLNPFRLDEMNITLNPRWSTVTVRLAYEGTATRFEYSGETHNTLPAKRVIDTLPFLLFGVRVGHRVKHPYDLTGGHRPSWNPPEWRKIHDSTDRRNDSIFDKMFDADGLVKWGQMQAELAACSRHGPSPFLALSIMDGISRRSEDLAVAYASRPDIAPLIAGNEAATKLLEKAANRDQLPLPLRGLGGLSRAGLREVRSHVGMASAGVRDFGPADNLLKLPKLSAATQSTIAKFNFD